MQKGTIEKLFDVLFEHFGPQNWWPGDSPLEIIVGAVLMQNTAWKNVEKAITNLKEKGLLDVEKILGIEDSYLAEIIKPSGFYNLKAKRLKSVLKFVKNNRGIEVISGKEIHELRSELLKVPGVGKETADSIILYALGKPIFVVDAYTRRILKRIGIIDDENMSYDEIQRLFHENLPNDEKLFNEFHALFVALGKKYCLKRNPLCNLCPVKSCCRYGREFSGLRGD